MKLSCVILTMGNRPAELARAIASTAPLRRDGGDLVVVGNGAEVPPVPDGVTKIRLPENVGVAAGRNVGVDAATGDVVLFLDDDGWYPDAGLGEYIAGRFAADPMLAVVSFRVVDPAGGPGARWHVPTAAGRRSGAVVRGDNFRRGGVRDPAVGLPGGWRPARTVLLRARGDRPRLAADGPRLPA